MNIAQHNSRNSTISARKTHELTVQNIDPYWFDEQAINNQINLETNQESDGESALNKYDDRSQKASFIRTEKSRQTVTRLPPEEVTSTSANFLSTPHSVIANRNSSIISDTIDLPIQFVSNVLDGKKVQEILFSKRRPHLHRRETGSQVGNPVSKNSQTSNANGTRNDTEKHSVHLRHQKGMILPASQEIDRIDKAQHKGIDRLQSRHGLIVDETQLLSRINQLVEYLLKNSGGKARQNRLNNVVRNLLKPLDMYGSEKGEQISHDQKIAVIADFIHRVVLGMPFDDWCITQIHHNKSHLKKIPHHTYLQGLLTAEINNLTQHGSLSLQAHAYYDDVLKKSLPTLFLQPIADEEKTLQQMDITQPQCGFFTCRRKIAE